MEKKKATLFYNEWISFFEALSNEDAGILIKNIFRYINGQPADEQKCPVFEFIKMKIQDNIAYYEQICLQNKENAYKRWNTTACDRIQTDAKICVNDNDKKNDKKKDKEKKRERPSLSDVQKHISENKYNVDATAFISHYESNGWKVGKNPMKDWKAAIRGWHARNKGNSPSQIPQQPFGTTAAALLKKYRGDEGT